MTYGISLLKQKFEIIKDPYKICRVKYTFFVADNREKKKKNN